MVGLGSFGRKRDDGKLATRAPVGRLLVEALGDAGLETAAGR